MCSFFDLPETFRDYEDKYDLNCELLLTAAEF
jgi:hypothetical protein